LEKSLLHLSEKRPLVRSNSGRELNRELLKRNRGRASPKADEDDFQSNFDQSVDSPVDWSAGR
jgi:hypothetical protein